MGFSPTKVLIDQLPFTYCKKEFFKKICCMYWCQEKLDVYEFSIGLMCGHSLDFDANSTMILAVQHQRGNSLSFQTIDSTICSLFSCPASIDHDSDILTNNSNPCGPYTICLLSRVAGKQKPLQQQYTHGNHFGKWEKATKLLQF